MWESINGAKVIIGLVGILLSLGIWVGTMQSKVWANEEAVKEQKKVNETVVRMDERQKKILEILEKLEKKVDGS